MTSLFKADPGHIFDFSTKSPAQVFNEAILPRVNAFDSFLSDPMAFVEEGRRKRDAQREQDFAQEAYLRKTDEDFFTNLRGQRPAEGQDYSAYAIEPMGDYDSAEPQPSSSVPAKGLTDFVKNFEGFNPKAYSDYKQWSVGYGTKGRKGEVIDKAEAERRLQQELGRHRARVEKLNVSAGYNFTDNELDALTSFDYNTGRLEQLTANGKRSKEEIANMMLKYNKAGGKALPGLTSRRAAEHQLFTKGY
jgi:lysozyme